MPGTVATDFTFVPKVWSDHITGYFDRKLTYGAFATPNKTLVEAPGTTINFPFFTAIGDAEDAAEGTDLTVDKIGDNAFSATVKETGKAVSFTDKSLHVSAASKDTIFSEAQEQVGRVMAEKVDKDLIAEINGAGNFATGFTAAAAADVCTVRNLFKARIIGFGDKADQAAVIFMHSLHYLSMMNDTSTGLMNADANDPMYNVPGFMGRLFGAAVVVVDTVPAGPTVDSKTSYYSFICKPNAFGLITKAEVSFETDRDILARETVLSCTHWYAVKSFHGKISASDKRVTRALFATEIAA